ncbi:MAG: cation-transporting P-type ATPase, partial [Gammaproteobacteria bacterium]|nr:cation-transporting P-type ATPase [Gammaproteobacteria bacterium]
MKRQIPSVRITGLAGSATNLSAEEARNRHLIYGANNILQAPVATWFDLLRDTLLDPMLWFLVITSSLFIIIGEYLEAIILAIAIIPLAGMDAYLHRRTQASVASLGRGLAVTSRVIRDDKEQIVPSIDLVPGDLVVLDANEYVPADGVIVSSEDAQVDESALTGEAFPVRKIKTELFPDTGDTTVEDTHCGFAGTRVLTGSLHLRVVFTGNETLYGDIVRTALQGRHAKTPLQLAIANLVMVLLVAAAILCLLVAWVRWIQGFGLLDALVSAMTLAVAALPEEYPVVFTFFLGVGVYRLAQRRALVRRAVAVENIGRVSTICSDKTGTLTLGQLRLTHVFPVNHDGREKLLHIAASASRNDSNDPLDTAIFHAMDFNPETIHHVVTFPFTEDRKRETALIRNDDNNLYAVVKGAPEVILQQCVLSTESRQALLDKANQLAAEGHKVIACASRVLDIQTWTDHEPVNDFIYAGLLALEDPVREGAADAVRQCQQAGIHVIMITGDHPLTARAVAVELGIGQGKPRVVNADEIQQDIKANPDLLQIDVIARSIPSQKLHFVRQLQAQGEIVAVTGDGVNDVPALQIADVGIAMGERGTQAAREVSAVVLLDDNFRTIVRAIAEGAQLFKNLRLSFAYLLMVHIPLVLSAALIPLAGFPLLYLPIHIVWLELIIHPTALLVFQQLPAVEDLPHNKHRTVTRFFTRTEWVMITLVGLLLTVVVTGGYVYSLGIGRNIEHARSMALAVMCLGSAWLTVSLSGLKTRVSRTVAGLALVSALILIQSPVSTLLHMQPLHLTDWLIALCGS